MATIKTAEGESLIVEDQKKSTRLYAEADLSFEDRIGKTAEESVWKFFSKASQQAMERPRSRGDLTADTMEDLANLVIGYAVSQGWADRRSEVTINKITIHEKDEAKKARQAYVPDWEDDWPEDGSASDRVRFMLDHDSAWSDEEIAVAAGCSRSLVSDIKAEREEE